MQVDKARLDATYTHEASEAGHLYYITLGGRSPAPYTEQRHVQAILDIASDGTLAGVELIDNMPPPPLRSTEGKEGAKTVAYLIDCPVEPCLEFADVDVPDAAIPLVRRSELAAAEANVSKLLRPFRNVDESDWHHLFAVLPDTARGKFWKAVFTEARAALTRSPE